MTTTALGIAVSNARNIWPISPFAVPMSRSAGIETGRIRRASVQNKPNLPRFWPKNADHKKKQSQTNPIGAAVLSGAQRSRTDLPAPVSTLKSQISDAKGCPCALSSFAPNKPNLPGPWIPLRHSYAVAYVEIQPVPEPQKQTQTKPILMPDSSESVAGFQSRQPAHPDRMRQRPLPPRRWADSMAAILNLASCNEAGREGRTTQ